MYVAVSVGGETGSVKIVELRTLVEVPEVPTAFILIVFDVPGLKPVRLKLVPVVVYVLLPTLIM